MATGLDILRKELISRGFTKQQVYNSKMIPAALDILANSGTEYTDLNMLRMERDVLRENNQRERRRLDSINKLCNELTSTVLAAVGKELTEQREYLEQVMEALAGAETAEGRDALRKAQMFVDAVNVSTKYDNTAFIIGLASILSGEKMAPMQQLQKINPKLYNGVPSIVYDIEYHDAKVEVF